MRLPTHRLISVIFKLFLLMKVVVGMIDFTPSMLNATTVDEILTAWKRPQTDFTSRQRRRKRPLGTLQDSPKILASSFNNIPGFYHGVASGDPLPNSVIVWTRYTPMTSTATVLLELRMVEVNASSSSFELLDPTKNSNIRRALVNVSHDTDFIAKIDVTGLPSKTKFLFAFSDGTKTSLVGQTQTTPDVNDTVDSMTYAVFSCANYGNGYFHAYDVASTIKDLDLWIHLGDYMYEYGTYRRFIGGSKQRRSEILPTWEAISLQDYRNRMATYHRDPGLQNLRRRAPLFAIWDDHESANNAYGKGSASNTGAENHQPTCPVGVNALDKFKDKYECDRNEGDAVTRFNAAAQAYMEWIPLRTQPGTMGVVNIGSITRVISWGDMATIVGFDTRISYRSGERALTYESITSFVKFAALHPNVRAYTNPKSMTHRAMMKVARKQHALQQRSAYTMIGENINVLQTSFEKSKNIGQPWQIWAAATALARTLKGNYLTMGKFHPDKAKGAAVNRGLLKSHRNLIREGILLRAFHATAASYTPWNRDDFSGYAYEQRKIIKTLQETAANPIVLGGDLHDSYAWQLYENGTISGKPVAVNLITPAVSSPGWKPIYQSAFKNIVTPAGGEDELLKMIESADEEWNPGLKYHNVRFNGFFAVKMTKTNHIAEYFGLSPEILRTPYDAAVMANAGGITAKFFCDAQITTIAGSPGSIDRSDTCSAIQFDTSRPTFWNISFPTAITSPKTILSDCGYNQCVFASKPPLT